MSVTLHTTIGDLKIELFASETPMTCENFLALCAMNYYDGCLFHRRVKGFMIQTGDPSGTGRGGRSASGKNFADEMNARTGFAVRGMLGMATSGPNQCQSQFFATFAPAPHLDGKVGVFGRIIDGFDTLDALERLVVDERDRPVRDVKIERVTIHANPFAR